MMPAVGEKREPSEVAPSSVAASACAPLSATHLHCTYPALARTVLAKKLRSLDDSSLNQLLSKAAAAGGEGLTDGPQSDSAGEPQGAGMSGVMGGGGSGSGGGPAEGGEAAEREAKAALDALKEATLIRSKKADWRLVAAAQAIRRGEFKDEFEAAAAMGKSISRRREARFAKAK